MNTTDTELNAYIARQLAWIQDNFGASLANEYRESFAKQWAEMKDETDAVYMMYDELENAMHGLGDDLDDRYNGYM